MAEAAEKRQQDNVNRGVKVNLRGGSIRHLATGRDTGVPNEQVNQLFPLPFKDISSSSFLAYQDGEALRRKQEQREILERRAEEADRQDRAQGGTGGGMRWQVG